MQQEPSRSRASRLAGSPAVLGTTHAQPLVPGRGVRVGFLLDLCVRSRTRTRDFLQSDKREAVGEEVPPREEAPRKTLGPRTFVCTGRVEPQQTSTNGLSAPPRPNAAADTAGRCCERSSTAVDGGDSGGGGGGAVRPRTSRYTRVKAAGLRGGGAAGLRGCGAAGRRGRGCCGAAGRRGGGW